MGREAGAAGWTGLAAPQGHRGRNLGQGGGCRGDRLFMTEGAGLADGLHVLMEPRGRQGAQPRHKQGGRGWERSRVFGLGGSSIY